jgi:glutathione S-transferase
MEPAADVMTLYHVKWFCSSIPAQLAEELSLSDSQLVVKTVPDPGLLSKDPTLLRLSPRRVVPVLVLPDGSTICESAAIALYLCETFDKDGAMQPPVGSPTRAKFLQGVVYSAAEGYKATINVFMECFNIEKKDRNYEAIAKHKEKFQKVVIDHLVRELADGRPYYLGENMSLCDIMFGFLLVSAVATEENLLTNDIVSQYFGRLASRPSFKKYYTP